MNNNHGRRRTRRVRQQRKQQKTQIGRILLTVGLMALIAVVSIGGTIAWLTAQTQEITNTFTTSDVTVTLEETASILDDGDNNKDTNSYQMVPGNTITKDPKVTLTAGSEDSWVFVKLVKENDFDKYMSYEMATDWEKLEDGVYYYTGDITKGTPVPVIKDNKILVSDQLTKADMTMAETKKPQLKVTAYACQKANVNTAADAWKYINNGKTPETPVEP